MIKYNNLLWFTITLYILAVPFISHNHTLLYITAEIIGLIGLINLSQNDTRDKSIIKIFVLILSWELIVSTLSPSPKLSFQALGVTLILMFLFIGLAKIDFKTVNKQRLINIILITSIFSLLQALIVYFLPIINSIGNYNLPNFSKHISKVYISTISIAMIVFSLFFVQDKLQKWIIIISNIIAALILKDRFFLFILLTISLCYYFNYLHKISFKKIILVTIIVSFILLSILLYLNFDLNIYNRMMIYNYWIPKILLSPIYGFGIGLKAVAHYLTIQYPPSTELITLDKHILLHAHNVIIDTILQQGIIGLILYASLPVVLFKQLKKDNVDYQPFLYMFFAILAKNLVDDQFEGSKLLTFWLFIFLSYFINRKTQTN